MSDFSVKIVRRCIPTQELLADLTRVAKQLQTDRLSGEQYNQFGQFHSTTLAQRLGSWKIALQQAGLRPVHLFNVDPKLALADLHRVALQLATVSPKQTDYLQHGQFTGNTYRKLFGTWHRALQAAGLQPRHYRSLSDEELFNNLKQVWITLNRQPRICDLRPPLSLYTVGPYLTRFKTWPAALAAFDPTAATANFPPKKVKGPTTHINWRLRYKILNHDHFRCRACGRSPATHPTVTLQIDHIHPRSQGGSSDLKNLQTLCNLCNSGKGDLTP